ncbi:MAG TPA: hypothetical protein VM103_01265, partial [Candidatus Paceibacterota bacterium]|nr:hypothetical protein [Candidatus Paceibacterota bacterium]
MKKMLLMFVLVTTLFAGIGGVGVPMAHAENTTPPSPTAAQVHDTGQAVTPPTSTGLGEKFNPVIQWVLGLFAWLLTVASLTLDRAVYFTVVTMGTYVNGLSAVGVAWRILRDICNIALI